MKIHLLSKKRYLGLTCQIFKLKFESQPDLLIHNVFVEPEIFEFRPVKAVSIKKLGYKKVESMVNSVHNKSFRPDNKLMNYLPIEKASKILYRSKSGSLCINGSFFMFYEDLKSYPYNSTEFGSRYGDPVGWFRINHIDYGFSNAKRPSICINGNDTVDIKHVAKSKKTKHAISCGPTLIKNGRLTNNSIWKNEGFLDNVPPATLTRDLYEYKSARTGIATYKNSNNYSLVVSESKTKGEVTGLTLSEFAKAIKLIAKVNNKQIKDCVYLDGGGCSSLSIRTKSGKVKLLNTPSGISNPKVSGSRPGEECYVGYALILFPKK